MRLLFKLIFLWGLAGLLAALATALAAAAAAAQDIDRYVKVTSAPAWIDKIDPIRGSDGHEDRDSYYDLVDWQTQIKPRDRQFYARYSEVLQTPQAVEDNGNIAISFDPTYERLELHFVHVIRDGVVLDRTDLSAFTIYRSESDRDKLVYNGTLEISYIVPDIRVGDTLDYAFTRKGKNPAFFDEYRVRFQQRYSTAANLLARRVFVDQSLPVHTKTYHDPVLPEISTAGRYKKYSWDITQREPYPFEDDRPSWSWGSPTYVLGSLNDWADVGRVYAPHYITPAKLPRALQTEVDRIRTENSDPKARTRAALDYVQKNIRYLGIEMGEGGYIPRPVSKTMANRFGDCKDMTILLVAMLRALDIQADPLLVHSEERGGIDRALPALTAFDHVVVRADIDGQAYVLDPTRGEQLGDLDHMQQGYFVKGVVIAPDSPGLVDVPGNEPEFYEVFNEHWDLVSAAPDVLFELETIYYQGSADSYRSWFISSGAADIEKTYLEYYLNLYAGVEQVGDMAFEFSDTDAFAKSVVKYKIPDPWEVGDTVKTLPIYAGETSSNVPDFDGSARTFPFSLSHPNRSRQAFNIKVDETWSFDEGTFEKDNPAFTFKKVMTHADNIYREVYDYKSKSDHIAPGDFAAVMKDISAVDDNLGVTMQYSVDGAVDDGDMVYLYFALYLLLATIISLVLLFGFPKWDAPDALAEQIYYPVGMGKFLLMTVGTGMIYIIYWSYKNWRWATQHRSENLMAGVRAFFNVFMNFALFPRFRHSDITAMMETPLPDPRSWENRVLSTATISPGFAWYGAAAIPLAILYLIFNIMFAVEDGQISLYMGYPAMILVSLVPVAQLNKINGANTAALARNSSFRLRTIIALLLWLPFGLFLFPGIPIMMLMGLT